MRNGWLLDQLPGHMADDEFLTRFLGIFQEVATSLAERADEFEHLIDPTVAPPTFVRYMGHWLGVDIDADLPIERQRQFVDAAGDTLALRGTRNGLAALLKTVTLGEVEIVDEGGTFPQEAVPPNDKHVVITIEQLGETPADKLVELIADEIPVDCTFELRVAGDDDSLYDGRPASDSGPTTSVDDAGDPAGGGTADDSADGEASEEPAEHHSRLHELTRRVDELLASTLHRTHDLPQDTPTGAPGDDTAAQGDSVDDDEQKHHWWKHDHKDEHTDSAHDEEEPSGDV